VLNRDISGLLFIVILTAFALWINFNTTFLGRDVSTRLGLDLRGGIQVVLRAEQGEGVSRELMQTAAGVIERRVNALGVGETVVQLAGNNSIIVELPGVQDPEQAIETLRGTGQLEFIDPQGQQLFEGQLVRTENAPEIPESLLRETAGITSTEEVTSAAALANQAGVIETIFPSITQGADLDTSQVQPVMSQTGSLGSEPAVAFAFSGESATNLARFSAQSIGQQMCIVLDHRVVSCPIIQAALSDGSGVITTNTIEDRNRIYNQLKFGALPVALQVETSRSVSATLGAESVSASVIAGIIGLTVVAVFMILYYRLPGVLAVIALLIYTALNFAIYQLIPVTLTLPGIAGFILSIGLAVDANVLIFARLKEELRHKKELRPAIESGFKEAWSAIRDASVSTLITSTILWIFGNSFGVSLIKGFAITLGLGVLLSIFTAVFVTRTLLRVMVAVAPKWNPWFFAVGEVASTPAEVPAEAEPETV
jgi:preprotein translocase subunit SecD